MSSDLLEEPGQGTIALDFSNGTSATGSGRGTMLLEVTEEASVDGCMPSAELGGVTAGAVWSGGLVLPSWEEGARSVMVGATLDFSQTDPEAAGAETPDRWTGTVELVRLDASALELSLLEGELCLSDAPSCESATGSHVYEGEFQPATQVASGVASGWTDDAGSVLCRAAEFAE